jgi:hypothetical protein
MCYNSRGSEDPHEEAKFAKADGAKLEGLKVYTHGRQLPFTIKH